MWSWYKALPYLLSDLSEQCEPVGQECITHISLYEEHTAICIVLVQYEHVVLMPVKSLFSISFILKVSNCTTYQTPPWCGGLANSWLCQNQRQYGCQEGFTSCAAGNNIEKQILVCIIWTVNVESLMQLHVPQSEVGSRGHEMREDCRKAVTMLDPWKVFPS